MFEDDNEDADEEEDTTEEEGETNIGDECLLDPVPIRQSSSGGVEVALFSKPEHIPIELEPCCSKNDGLENALNSIT